MKDDDKTGVERALLARIRMLRRDLAALLTLWHERRDPGLGWTATPRVHAELARAFIEVGAPLLGLEVAAEGLAAFAEDVSLRQAQGLALARSGSTEDANSLLQQLQVEGHLDDDTLGVLARTHKDLALGATGAARHRHLQAALRLYGDAYARGHSYWTGINVATLAALLGDRAQSVSVARQLVHDCRAELARLPADHADRYWVLATLGEAALCMEDWAQAEDWYAQAGAVGGRRFGDLNSTRRHARLLLEHFERDAGIVDAWLPLPRVILFSGHMIDRPDRTRARFPPSMEKAVAAAIRGWLRENQGLIGFSSAACGADLLFLEAIHELGGETHIVLPYHQDEFVADSVEIAGVGGWRDRFERALAFSRVVYASSSRPLHGGVAYDYANDLVHGLGCVRASELETELAALAVWDGRAGDGRGGTASAVRQWQVHDIPVHRVRLEAAPEQGAGSLEVVAVRPGAGPATTKPASPARDDDDAVMALLFADAIGFSRLTDAEVPLFVDACLGLVARLIAREEAVIPVRETWGDGLFLAFTGVRAAGLFALDMLDALAATDWLALGFSRPLTMRLALHAGPVHRTTDPITKLPKCCGTHVSRAARLEPKTPAGQVYASEAFAALAAMDGVQEFRCDYVKQLDWAKRYGTFPAYVLRRQAAQQAAAVRDPGRRTAAGPRARPRSGARGSPT
ncbi:MAG TPA: TRAFs-binding domain-containing protein [Gammaproteobacteria bacterium]|nr:TRAFs-binding domain-containing protein [Gammaproteobacteria bacterium]